MTDTSFDQLCINTIRLLAADAVQKANSGHPGMPMGDAPMAHVLWTRFMNYNPQDPQWSGRDRFVLSAGHGCMLQYSMLHLTGYKLSMDDIKQFRQLHSITPGHPEKGLTPGIEVTTGPLGQGFANGVGLAIGQKYLAAKYNKPDFPIFDYKIYAICSDGDLMEGISSEAGSIAGHLKLGNLIYLYDDNHISIEGDTKIAFTEDTAKRFEAFGWHVQEIEDGNDIDKIAEAVENAKKETERPSLIKIRTHIAYGSPNKVDSASAHGSALGKDEVAATKKNLGWDPEKSFYVPEEVETYYQKYKEIGKEKQQNWEKLYDSYKEKYPELAKEYEMFRDNKLPDGWDDDLPVFKEDDGPMATRSASGKALNAMMKKLPNLIGGAADLQPSTDTLLKDMGEFEPNNYTGRNFHFGVREHAMGAITNGMEATRGIIPYCATFLIFSDYMRPPIRLAAIMKIRPIFIYTHDSIGLGEDGTTHQPVEQLAGLRAVPNLTLIRPADANETAQAWKVAISHQGGPVVLVLTRQKLKIIDQQKFAPATNVQKGAYILSDTDGKPDVILLATGSEVELILGAQEELKKDNIKARVVSMPSWELFEKQSDDYKKSVLPPDIKKRISVEAASTFGWHKYITDEGVAIGMHTFGESAPGDEVMKEFGFTVENVCKHAKKLLGK